MTGDIINLINHGGAAVAAAGVFYIGYFALSVKGVKAMFPFLGQTEFLE